MAGIDCVCVWYLWWWPCDVLWYLAPASPESRTALVTGAGVRTRARSPDGAGRCPACPVPSAAWTHYAILRVRQLLKYSNDNCHILPQNSWETWTWTIIIDSDLFNVFMFHLFIELCANILAIYDASDLNLYSRGLTSAGNKGNVKHHVIPTWLTMNQRRKAKIRLTFAMHIMMKKYYTHQPPFYYLNVNQMSKVENNNLDLAWCYNLFKL